jgi:hypothetical protein
MSHARYNYGITSHARHDDGITSHARHDDGVCFMFAVYRRLYYNVIKRMAPLLKKAMFIK